MQDFLHQWNNDDEYITVETSGSTGTPKVMRVEKKRMRASAVATCRFLRLPQGATALLCMPTRYIAGKMMVVRAEVWPLRLIEVEPSRHPLATFVNNGVNSAQEPPFFAAMTPAQAYDSLLIPEEREVLLRIPRLLLGGGAISSELEEKLQQSQGEVWSSYGMTETLSHIALRRIQEPYYTLLPNIRIGLNEEQCLWIDAPHLCPTLLQTNDIAEVISDSSFRILGRRDNVINSGGIKLQLEEVESEFASATGLQSGHDFVFSWITDSRWEQALTLLLTSQAATSLQDNIPATPYLKHTFITANIPLTPTGKPARKQIHQLAEHLKESLIRIEHPLS